MTCASCGCDDDHACVDTETGNRCSWYAPDLCNFCAVELGVIPEPVAPTPPAPTLSGEPLGTLYDAYGVRIR